MVTESIAHIHASMAIGARDYARMLSRVSAHRAAVTALNFYNQMAADLRGLKQ